MVEKKKKSEIRVESDGIVEEIVSEERNGTSKKRKTRENKDCFGGEDKEIIVADREKLGEGDVVKKKSKKRRVDSESEDDAKKLKKKNKEMKADYEADDDGGKKFKKKRVESEAEDDAKILKKTNKEIRADSETYDHCGKKSKKKSADSEADDHGGKKSKKKHKEIRVESEADDDVKKKKSKKDFDGEEIGNSEGNQKNGNKSKKEKRKREDSDLGAEENTQKSSNEVKRKSKKEKKPSVDSEVEENRLNSVKDAKKKSNEKKPSEDPEVEENNKKSSKGIENSEAEEKDLNSKRDTKKKQKKKKSEDSEVEENNNGYTKDTKRKQNCSNIDKVVATPSSKSTKRVTFSDIVEYFPTESEEENEEQEEEELELVRGKRFTKEEDNLIQKSVLEYIENHALGEEGIKMVMCCKSHPQVKGCWKEIASALPWRPSDSIYHRAHTIFEEGSKGIWTKEDLELVKRYQSKHGNQWKTLAEAMGKHRNHVKDTWRRLRLNKSKGNWSKEEYQTLFDLVNNNLKTKSSQGKHSKHGMLRDNIPWMAISDELGTRDHATCCNKWYEQLMSPMVVKGIWDNVDDYRLLDELMKLDSACFDDVDWDEILENRDGEVCRKRWKEMVQHIGLGGSKTFGEQVEILSQRYCPDLGEDREDFDNRPFDPED